MKALIAVLLLVLGTNLASGEDVYASWGYTVSGRSGTTSKWVNLGTKDAKDGAATQRAYARTLHDDYILSLERMNAPGHAVLPAREPGVYIVQPKGYYVPYGRSMYWHTPAPVYFYTP